MGEFTVGSIVLISFPFSNLTGSKKRPALVLAEVGNGDYILVQVTSKAWSDPHAIRINSEDYSKGSLPLESFIRPGKIFTGNDTIFIRAVAQVTPLILNSVKQTLIKLIQDGSFSV